MAAVIPARNEESFIGKTLEYLTNQEFCLTRTIVVDDGSTDNTAGISRSYGAEVISNPDRGFAAQGMPLLAGVLNKGLQVLHRGGWGEDRNDYVMMAGADHLLPPRYITEMLQEMNSDRKIAICSGQIQEERSVVPKGVWKIDKSHFLRELGFGRECA